MNVGLIDVDGHNFPNLALMRISAYHKARGDRVSWWWGWEHYDVIYKSKVFSNEYTPDIPDPVNADRIIRGGTGYAISLDENGREIYDRDKDETLPADIEKMRPDYSIYPQYDFAISMTSRGCPRSCPFCIVSKKEGRGAVKVASVADFYDGQKHIEVLDPNITACRNKRELFREYHETRASITFSQGLDIRLIDDADIEDLNKMKIERLHFAYDNPEEDLVPKFEYFAKHYKRKDRGTVYILTNFNSSLDQDLFRIYSMRDRGFRPYVMVYNKPSAPEEILHLSQWVNNAWIFNRTPRFEDYDASFRKKQRVTRGST